MKRPEDKWQTEAALCSDFVTKVRDLGWAVYPETFDFDFVLVGPSGRRFGVEAKTKANLQVLAQAIRQQHKPLVHCRAVLVPQASCFFHDVARALRVFVITHNDPRTDSLYFRYELERLSQRAHGNYVWAENMTCELPGLFVDTPCGVPGPRKLTRWKLSAVRFCVTYRGTQVTTEMFKAADLNMSLWVKQGWVKLAGFQTNPKTGRRVSLYEFSDDLDCPDLRYPEIAAALRQDSPKAA